jgi:hypothetical protein
MVINMNAQPYCMVDTTTNVCDNVVMWDGNQDTWTPPSDHLMLVQATTPSKVWSYDSGARVWSLVASTGAGQIGFTWDGTYLVTNEPQPAVPTQPTTTGTQTL